jgi:hypothetical protein
LSFKDVNTFTNGAAITLSDKFMNKTVVISEGTVYNFSITSSAASYGAARFELNFSANPSVADFSATAQAICENLNAEIKLGQSQQSVLYHASINGTALTTPALGTGAGMTIVINKQNLVVGQNLVIIQAVSAGCSSTILNKEVTVTVNKTPVVFGEPAFSCKPLSIKLKAQSTGSVSFNWFESEAALTPDLAQHDSIYTTPVLTESRTYYVSGVGTTGCESPRVPIAAEIGKLPDVSITEASGTLTSNYPNNNQWYLDDVILANETGQTIQVKESGNYKVQVSEAGCSASAEFRYDVVMQTTDGSRAQLMVYPNPVRTILTLEVARYTDQPISLTILNSVGQILGTVQLNQGVDKQFGEFDMSAQLSGMYFIRANVNGKISNIKVMKE